MYRGMICPGNAVSKAHPLNRGLVSWWLNLPNRLGGGGATFRDLMGRNHGTLTGGPTWQGAMGRPGGFGSLAFNGTSQYGTTSVSLSPPWTISLWVRWDGAAGFPIWLSASGSPDLTFGVEGPGGVDRGLFVSNSVYLTPTYIPPANTWLHITYQATATVITAFVNSVSVASASVAYPAFTTFDIGRRYAGDSYFGGHLDDIRMASGLIDPSALYQDSLRGYPQTLNRVRPATAFDAGGGGAATNRSRYMTLIGVA